MVTPSNLYDYYTSQGKTLATTAAGRFADPAFAAAANAAGYNINNYSVSTNNGAANSAILAQLLKTGASSTSPAAPAETTYNNGTVYNYKLPDGSYYSGPQNQIPTSSPSGNTPYVSSSNSVLTQENNTSSALKSLMAQTPDYKTLIGNYQDATDTIANYQAQLEARRQAEVNAFGSQYEQIKTDLQAAQMKEKNSTNVAITRLGGYLGNSGSGMGVMNNLAVTHRAELAKLDTQRDAAIQAANTAIDDKQFALAQEKINEANKIIEDIYSRQQDFFNNSIKLADESRAEQDQVGQNAKNILDAWQYISDPSTISGGDKSYIDSVYGQGFSDQYLKAQAASQKAKSQKDQIDAMQSYVNLLESVPAGTKIPFGDETITGIGKTSDISTFQVEDANGNVRIVNYNKGNGQFGVTNLGQVGKGSTPTQGDKAANAIAQANAHLIPGAKLSDGTPVYDSDGNITPPAWKSLVSNLTSAGIGIDTVLQTYGNLIVSADGKTVPSAYGLTPVQIQKYILGNQ